MEICLGVLKIQPEQFWSMTYREVDAAIRGHKEASGLRKRIIKADRSQYEAFKQQMRDKGFIN